MEGNDSSDGSRHFTFHPSVSHLNIPARTFLDANPGFDGLASGSLVFTRAPPSPPPPPGPSNPGSAGLATERQDRLLIIQRAAQDSMPSRWEVPGGAVDADDASILAGLARELREETGLRLVRAGELVGEGLVFFTRRNLRICKFSFEVEVEGGGDEVPAVVLSHEHQRFLWVTEEECRARRKGDLDIKFTHEGQERTIFEGFRMRRERKTVDAGQ